MFIRLVDTLRNDPVESLTRPGLFERLADLREIKGATAVYEARVVRAVDALGDSGPDGAAVMRSAGRLSGSAAGLVAKTAAGLEDLTATTAALETGRITLEHADTIVSAGEDVTPKQADTDLVGLAEMCPRTCSPNEPANGSRPIPTTTDPQNTNNNAATAQPGPGCRRRPVWE